MCACCLVDDFSANFRPASRKDPTVYFFMLNSTRDSRFVVRNQKPSRVNSMAWVTLGFDTAGDDAVGVMQPNQDVAGKGLCIAHYTT